MENENNGIIRRHRKPKERDRYFKIRNILNIIFMIGAVIGVLWYIYSDRTIGIIVVLSAMVFKMAECCLRFFR
ncbi:MAG: hypothetical protein ACI350_08810 [Prevotella sp.]